MNRKPSFIGAPLTTFEDMEAKGLRLDIADAIVRLSTAFMGLGFRNVATRPTDTNGNVAALVRATLKVAGIPEATATTPGTTLASYAPGIIARGGQESFPASAPGSTAPLNLTPVMKKAAAEEELAAVKAALALVSSLSPAQVARIKQAAPLMIGLPAGPLPVKKSWLWMVATGLVLGGGLIFLVKSKKHRQE